MTIDGKAAAETAINIAAQVFPGTVTLPDSAEYGSERDKSWSPTCWLPAAGFVRPKNTEDVAKALAIVTKTGCKFAIRSGGHNQNSGIAGVDQSGIVIDLCGLKELSLGNDGVLSAGAGATWGEIYAFLEKRDRIAVGGRHNSVGVSGYILGGGIPAFINLYGFAADSLTNCEVVLGNSAVVNANAKEDPDLFRALKGGGPNFGIVTRFDIQTYPLAEIQYTVNVYDPSDYENVLRATAQVQRAAESDPKIGMFANCQGSFIALGFFYYGRTEKPPEAFQPFFKLGSLLQAAVPTTNGSVKSLVDSLALMDTVLRRLAISITTKVSEDLYLDVHKLIAEARNSHPKINNIAYSIQPVSQDAVLRGLERGGNPMGVEPVSQTVWAVVAEWNDAEDDAEAERALGGILQGIRKLAEEKGLLLDFIFMNDAWKEQKVLASYGKENLRELQQTADKFDPEGVFQRQQNDGFLLRRSLHPKD